MSTDTVLFVVGFILVEIGLVWLHPALFLIAVGVGCLWGSYEVCNAKNKEVKKAK